LPRKNGLTLARLIRERMPNVPVVLTTECRTFGARSSHSQSLTQLRRIARTIPACD